MKVYGQLATLLFVPRKNTCDWPVDPVTPDGELRDDIEVKEAANDA